MLTLVKVDIELLIRRRSRLQRFTSSVNLMILIRMDLTSDEHFNGVYF